MSTEVDQRARLLARELRLKVEDYESYEFCVCATLREDPLLNSEYAQHPVTRQYVRGLFRKLARLLSAASGRTFSEELWALYDMYPDQARFIGWSLV